MPHDQRNSSTGLFNEFKPVHFEKEISKLAGSRAGTKIPESGDFPLSVAREIRPDPNRRSGRQFQLRLPARFNTKSDFFSEDTDGCEQKPSIQLGQVNRGQAA